MPSGVSYVISNRRVMAQTLPELFVSMRVRPVGDYPNKLLQALRARAPSGVDDPTVVVLTPGVYNSAYFEHTLLARLMGVELVEGRDLFCSGGRVFMRTTSRPQPRRRHLPPGRRRVPRPAAVPRRLDARLARPHARRPARQRHHRQRGRQRRRRRQARLHLRARPDPLLPGARSPSCRTSTPGASRIPGRSRRCSTASTSSWSSRSTAPAARASSSARRQRASELDALRTAPDRRPARLDRAARRAALDHPHPRRRRHAPASRRPAPVRRQRRRGRLGAARRPHPRRAARGAARRQLQPGRRLEGHLGRRADPATVADGTTSSGLVADQADRDLERSRSSPERTLHGAQPARRPATRTSSSNSSKSTAASDGGHERCSAATASGRGGRAC